MKHELFYNCHDLTGEPFPFKDSEHKRQVWIENEGVLLEEWILGGHNGAGRRPSVWYEVHKPGRPQVIGQTVLHGAGGPTLYDLRESEAQFLDRGGHLLSYERELLGDRLKEDEKRNTALIALHAEDVAKLQKAKRREGLKIVE